MSYLNYMSPKIFLWRGSLTVLVLFCGIIQAILGGIFGEKSFWIVESVMFLIIIMMYIENRKYNSLVGNSKLEYACYREEKSFVFPILSRGLSKLYIFCICYEYENQERYYITTVIGEDHLKMLKELFVEAALPMAVSYNGSKSVLLIQEYYEVHGLCGQGLEMDCFPICLLVYVPKILVLLLLLY